MGSIGDRFIIGAPRPQTPWRCRWFVRAAVLTAALGSASCTISVDQRGNLPDPDKLAQVQPGSTTKEQLAKILGTPSSASAFNDDSWYYISRRTKQVAFLSPTVLDQQVFIVNFDNKGVVKDIDHRTLADGESITPAPGATPAPGRELTFIEQLIGNIGRFNSGSATPSQ
jgi:outer membrane protein assembly factor BamE (lipoprotein component of BamABCDE complex)